MLSSLVILALAAAFALPACSKSPPSTEPEDGYLAFKSALRSRDPQWLRSTLSEEPQSLVRESFLNELEPPCELFRFVFAKENIPVDSIYALGLEVKSVENVDEERTIATTSCPAEASFGSRS